MSGPARLLSVSHMIMALSLKLYLIYFSKFIMKHVENMHRKMCPQQDLAFSPAVRTSEDLSVQYLSLPPFFVWK